MQEAEKRKIRRIQLRALELLNITDQICRKHQIDYSLCGGSAVGAYLEKGCLYWDDDIDVMMTRENYDRFLAVCQEELPAWVEVLNFHANPDVCFLFTKLVDRRTTYVQEQKNGKKQITGIFLDITVYDQIPEAGLEYHCLHGLWHVSQWLLSGLSEEKNFRSRLRNRLVRPLLFRKKEIYSLLETRLRRASAKKNGQWAEVQGAYCSFLRYPAPLFSSYAETEFEGARYSVVRDLRRYLEIRYDRRDFRIPEEEKKPDHVSAVDFSRPYREALLEERRPVRVCLIGAHGHPGGVETYCDGLLQSLDRNRYSFHFVSASGKPPCLKKYDPANCFTHTLPVSRRHPLAYGRAWLAFFRKEQFDVLWVHVSDLYVLDWLVFARLTGIRRVLLHSHNTRHEERVPLYLRALEPVHRRWLGQLHPVCLACSRGAGEFLFRGKKFQTVKNHLDVERYRFDPLLRAVTRRKMGVSEEYRVIGFAGRLEPQKNPLRFLDIFSAIRNQDSGSRAWIAGQGSLESRMKKKVFGQNLEEDICFLGPVKDMHAFYCACDVLIVCSAYEGLPFTLLEAQACGLPVVASDILCPEARVLESVECLSLQTPDALWAERALRMQADETIRLQGAEKMRQAGWDLKSGKRQLEELLERG